MILWYYGTEIKEFDMKILFFIFLLFFAPLSFAQSVSKSDYENLVKDLGSNSDFSVQNTEDIFELWRMYRDNRSAEIVRRIIQLLDDTNYSTGNATLDAAIRNAAEVTLKAHAGEFGEVKRIIIEYANSLPNGALKTKLMQIISALRNPR